MEKFVTVEGSAWKVFGDGSKEKPYNIGASKYNQDLIEDVLNEPDFKISFFVWGSSIFEAMRISDPSTNEFQKFTLSHTGRMVRLWGADGIAEEKGAKFTDTDLMRVSRDSIELVKAIENAGPKASSVEFLMG